MAAELPQARQGREDVDPVPRHRGLIGESLEQRTASPQLRQVELPLSGRQLAVAALLDAIRQLRRHLALEPAEEDRAELRREKRAGVGRGVRAVEAGGERGARAEVSGGGEGR